MTNETNLTSFIAAALPCCEGIVERLIENHSAFRDLCRDYRRCHESFERWSLGISADSKAKAREYAELLVELEQEIQTWTENARFEARAATNGENTHDRNDWHPFHVSANERR